MLVCQSGHVACVHLAMTSHEASGMVLAQQRYAHRNNALEVIKLYRSSLLQSLERRFEDGLSMLLLLRSR